MASSKRKQKNVSECNVGLELCPQEALYKEELQVRNPEPLSADLERIKSQIMDNFALMEQLKHKEGVLKSVKENAREILAHAKPNDAAGAGKAFP